MIRLVISLREGITDEEVATVVAKLVKGKFNYTVEHLNGMSGNSMWIKTNVREYRMEMESVVDKTFSHVLKGTREDQKTQRFDSKLFTINSCTEQ